MKWTGCKPNPSDDRSGQTGAQRAWNSAFAALVVVGVAANLGWFGWFSAVQVFVLTALASWIFALCLADDIRTLMRPVVRWSLVLSTAAVALVGLWALAHAWAVVAALSLLGCHPRVISWVSNRSTADPAGTSRDAVMTAIDPTSPAASHPSSAAATFSRPSRLSDAALRQSWEASWALLQRAKTLNEAMRIAEYRRTCLDEIDRRNPTTFDGWIKAGAPNADEPARQLPATFATKSSSCD